MGLLPQLPLMLPAAPPPPRQLTMSAKAMLSPESVKSFGDEPLGPLGSWSPRTPVSQRLRAQMPVLPIRPRAPQLQQPQLWRPAVGLTPFLLPWPRTSPPAPLPARRTPSPAAQTTIRRLQTPYMLASPTTGAATAPAATSTAAAPLESDDESSSWGHRWPRPPSGQAFRHGLDLPGQAPRGTLDRIGRLATLAIELSRQPHFPRHRTAS